jgi:hypothetical protein
MDLDIEKTRFSAKKEEREEKIKSHCYIYMMLEEPSKLNDPIHNIIMILLDLKKNKSVGSGF